MSLFFTALLVVAAFSTAMVAGLVYTFALLVMPGLGKLDNRGLLRGFQVIESIIQRGHPLFIVVRLGSIVSLLTLFILS